MAFSRSMPNFSMYDANCSAFQFFVILCREACSPVRRSSRSGNRRPRAPRRFSHGRTDSSRVPQHGNLAAVRPDEVEHRLNGRCLFRHPFSPIKPITVPSRQGKSHIAERKAAVFLQTPCSSSAFSLIILPPQTVSVPALRTRPQTVRPVSPPAQRPSGWSSTVRSCASRKRSLLTGANKAAASGLAGDKALALKLLIRTLGRDNADAQLLRQQTHRRQRLSRLQLSRGFSP